ncbi:MAG: helix-turn-helix domain-containing protein [Bacteroidia bacterium]|nr:helix-turn-helix domain-containing protein [Bacteroidia bacterium]
MKTNPSKSEIVVLTLSEILGLIKEEVKATVSKILKDPENFIQPEEEQLLDINQVAELLKTTPQNIHAKKAKGQIPFVRFGGRVLFKRSEVIASLKSIRAHRKSKSRL